MNIRRITILAAAATASLALGAAPAMAGNAHFIGSQTSASSSGATLTVKFKEAGLESGSVETIQVTAHLDATYQCINNGNKNPNDPKKTVVSGDFSHSDEFTAAKNGNVSGSLSVSAPAAASVLSCPPGQTSKLTVVNWSNIRLDDLTSGATLALPGSFSWGSPVN
jgi:hypothetical protein